MDSRKPCCQQPAPCLCFYTHLVLLVHRRRPTLAALSTLIAPRAQLRAFELRVVSCAGHQRAIHDFGFAFPHLDDFRRARRFPSREPQLCEVTTVQGFGWRSLSPHPIHSHSCTFFYSPDLLDSTLSHTTPFAVGFITLPSAVRDCQVVYVTSNDASRSRLYGIFYFAHSQRSHIIRYIIGSWA